jgi:hypothetical protein
VAVLRRKSDLARRRDRSGPAALLLHSPMVPEICDVLGCRNPAAHAIQVRPDDAALLEWMVCEEHRAPIEAGAPIRWDPERTDFSRGALVLGTDLPTVGLTITEVIAMEEHGLVLGPDGGPAVTLLLEKLNADGSHEDLRLTLSYEVMDQLGSVFEAYWRRRPGQGAPHED